jgi:hypothetical protein
MFKKDPTMTKLEDMQGDRLWAWLILCDDGEFLSLEVSIDEFNVCSCFPSDRDFDP